MNETFSECMIWPCCWAEVGSSSSNAAAAAEGGSRTFWACRDDNPRRCPQGALGTVSDGPTPAKQSLRFCLEKSTLKKF